MTSFIGADLANVWTEDELNQSGKGFGLNDRYLDHDGNEYVFVQATEIITGAGSLCVLDNTGQATMLDTSSDTFGLRIASPLSAYADNDYGWMQIYGNGYVSLAATVAANTQLMSTATGGVMDDTSTGVRADGVVALAATSGGAATVAAFLQYPRVGDTVA